MREFVKISPNRLVKFNDIDLSVASILEFISVGFHALIDSKKIVVMIKRLLQYLGMESWIYNG